MHCLAFPSSKDPGRRGRTKNEKQTSVKFLSLISITSILTTIYSLKYFWFMEDLVVITALNLSGSLERIWLSLKEKKLNVIHQPRVGPYWEKLCPPS